jgi:hypothetical protein
VVDYDHVFPRGWAVDIFGWLREYISENFSSSRTGKQFTMEIDSRFKSLAESSYPGIEKWPHGIFTERFTSSKYPTPKILHCYQINFDFISKYESIMEDLPFVLYFLFEKDNGPLACVLQYDIVKTAILEAEFWESSLQSLHDQIQRYHYSNSLELLYLPFFFRLQIITKHVFSKFSKSSMGFLKFHVVQHIAQSIPWHGAPELCRTNRYPFCCNGRAIFDLFGSFMMQV